MAIDWVDAYGNEGTGVDHLGMRVAGESAYSTLIDFTTTVSWRARYFPFWCWALGRAWERWSHEGPDGRTVLDVSTWAQTLKRYDYVMSAATLKVAPATLRVAGSLSILPAVRTAEAGGAALSVGSDHLRARTGSHGVYSGPMHSLGLLMSAKMVERPSSRGQVLAERFAESLGTRGAELFEQESLTQDELGWLGRRIGLTMLSAEGDANKAEALALLGALIPWHDFEGNERVRRRALTIGMLLRIHERLPTATLDEFRRVLLVGTAEREGERIAVSLPACYSVVARPWATYQAHAYANLALEGLLGVTLNVAQQLDAAKSGIAYPALLGHLAGLVKNTTASDGQLPRAFADWTRLTVDELVERVEPLVDAGGEASFMESELAGQVLADAGDGISDESAAWACDAILLFVLAVTRLKRQLEAEDTWLGHDNPARLPPSVLVDHLARACSEKRTIEAFSAETIDRLAVRQHHRTAMRKLEAMPSRDSAKLLLEGEHFCWLATHAPGMSYPRYANGVQFLEDLGLLHSDGTVTDAGRSLYARIEEQAQ